MKVVEIIHANGHENILSTNRTTFEITKDTHLTKQGDCIIATNANKGAFDLKQEFKDAMRRKDAKVIITIEADAEKETVKASGSPRLILTHLTDLVVRKSDYVCSRTLALNADKAAKDFSKALIRKLQDPKQTVVATLVVEASK